MSGDPSANCFGDPNAQPPTPRQTPASAALPSPTTFDTPGAPQESRFADPGAWTPRFVEEYSVFTSTPANLHSSRDTFTASTTPAPALHSRAPSFFPKRPLSTGDIAAEIASHANHFLPGPNLPLVAPSLRLSSSQLPPTTPLGYPPGSDTPQPTRGASEPGSPKENWVSCTGGIHDLPVQTATPPPSARKADRKHDAGANPTTMQNEEGYGHQDFLGAAQPADLAAFAAAQNDMFSYPMSAPVTASPSFWDSSISMSAMDLDFGSQNPTTSGMLFETPAPSQQPPETYDWNVNTALFQDPSAAVSNVPPHSTNQENIHPAPRKERPIAPKPNAPGATAQTAATVAEGSVLPGTYAAPANNGFILSPGRGVDPGLLFSRPPSSDTNTNSFPSTSQPGPKLGAGGLADPAPLISRNPGPDAVKRSSSYKETSGRVSATSPTKPTGSKAGLQRSFSESRGRRQLPALAPATRPQAPPASGPGIPPNNRPQPRQSGRISPSKLHHRLSSLSSIPESSGPRTRTSVKFTIDARGRAHAETTVVVDEPAPGGGLYRRTSRDSGRRSQVVESDPEDSDADDEPIIIPSRNASFALPDPHKPVGSIFHSSGKKSPRMRANFSFNEHMRLRHSPDEEESEAETVVNGDAGKGDATSELRKVVEDRQKRAASQRSQRVDTGAFTWAAGNLISPTARTDSTIPTPSTGPRHYRIRCVCQRNEPGGAIDAFMVQCEACELWLHGRCINITRRDMPPVYICAFCANTPNMRGGRIRDTGRGGMATLAHAPSPLAHKSFKSFR